MLLLGDTAVNKMESIAVLPGFTLTKQLNLLESQDPSGPGSVPKECSIQQN